MEGMETVTTVRRVDQPVKVTDNGIRSFVPPTFCFDLHDASGVLVDTVSQLIMDAPEQRGLRDFEALALLDRFGLLAIGLISEYDSGPQAQGVPGKRFSIERCVNNFEPP